MIFDSLNELLDTKRIFGIQGEVYPNKFLWRQKNIINKNFLNKIINKSNEEILDWSTYMCGFISDKEDSFLQLLVNLDDDVVKQIKEDRLVKLVNSELRIFDEKMFLVEEEVYEIAYGVAEDVFDELVEDLVTNFLKIK